MRRRHGLVDHWARRDARDLPASDVAAVVRVVAVRAGDQVPLVRRDRDEALERGRVADRPGREHSRGRHERECEHEEAAGWKPNADREHEEHEQEQGFAASQRRESHQRPEQRGPPRRRAVAEGVGGEHGEGHQQTQERLAHHGSVGGDQHGIDGGQGRGDEAGARARHAASEQPDGHDRRGP